MHCANGTHAKRALLASRLPAAAFHQDAHHDSHRLSQSLGTARMLESQEAVDIGQTLQLAHDARQRRPVVVQLRFFHAALSIGIVEELQYFVEGLLAPVEHVDEGAALAIF
jgi:hypothetical protein